MADTQEVDRSRTGYVPLTSRGYEKQELVIPDEEVEWVFDGNVAGAPDWIDKSAAGTFAGAPALHVSQLGPYSTGPHTTRPAMIGDTIRFTPKGPISGIYTVIPKSGVEDTVFVEGTWGVPQVSGAPIHGLVIQGFLKVEDLHPRDKAELAKNMPQLAKKLKIDDPTQYREVQPSPFAHLYGPPAEENPV
jgi:hypothetical protein